MADHYHLDVWDMLRTWTEPQFRRTLRWVHDAVNRPSLTDYYLMQIANYLLAEPKSDLEELRLKWRTAVKVAAPAEKPLTEKEAQISAMCRWGIGLGIMDQIVAKEDAAKGVQP